MIIDGMHPIDHIGIAVQSIDQELERYEKLYGTKPSHREKLPSMGVEVAFIDTPEGNLELIASTNESSTIKKFITNRGPGLHHICFRVSDLASELKRLKSLGVQLIDEIPRAGSRGALVAFIHPKSMGGVLVEYCQVTTTP